MDEMIRAFAPGRAELLGNHTDYNEGYVLAIAVDQGMTLTGRSRADSTVRLRSRALAGEVVVKLDQLAAAELPGWARYSLGVVDQFRRRGLSLAGFDAEIESDLPMGAGLSSSAALENATGLFLLRAFGGSLPPLEIARLSQQAEHDFVGVRCGLLDQIASLMSRAGHVTFIDCRTYRVEHIPLPKEVAIIMAHSGSTHALPEGAYNSRRADCEAAARALNVPFLRDVDSDRLRAEKAQLPDRVYRRAQHIVGENERVLAAAAALRRGEIAEFGRLMFESHKSSRVNFENSCPELDTLVTAARSIPGVWGARLSGGGFGGATINLVERARKEEVVRALASAFPAVRCLITSAANGALADSRNAPGS
jgi:galactokinase